MLFFFPLSSLIYRTVEVHTHQLPQTIVFKYSAFHQLVVWEFVSVTKKDELWHILRFVLKWKHRTNYGITGSFSASHRKASFLSHFSRNQLFWDIYLHLEDIKIRKLTKDHHPNPIFSAISLIFLHIWIRVRKNRRDQRDIPYIYLVWSIFRGLKWTACEMSGPSVVKKWWEVTQFYFMTKISYLIPLSW